MHARRALGPHLFTPAGSERLASAGVTLQPPAHAQPWLSSRGGVLGAPWGRSLGAGAVCAAGSGIVPGGPACGAPSCVTRLAGRGPGASCTGADTANASASSNGERAAPPGACAGRGGDVPSAARKLPYSPSQSIGSGACAAAGASPHAKSPKPSSNSPKPSSPLPVSAASPPPLGPGAGQAAGAAHSGWGASGRAAGWGQAGAAGSVPAARPCAAPHSGRSLAGGAWPGPRGRRRSASVSRTLPPTRTAYEGGWTALSTATTCGARPARVGGRRRLLGSTRRSPAAALRTCASM